MSIFLIHKDFVIKLEADISEDQPNFFDPPMSRS